jgi:hypothetical protein
MKPSSSWLKFCRAFQGHLYIFILRFLLGFFLSVSHSFFRHLFLIIYYTYTISIVLDLHCSNRFSFFTFLDIFLHSRF